jgi:hypothetical protein
MKAEIQKRLLHEVADLGDEDTPKLCAERWTCDPILGGFLRTRKANRREPRRK